MPVKPQGRVSYGGLSSALAGGLMPTPMGIYEGEMAPLLDRILSQLRKADEIGIPNIPAWDDRGSIEMGGGLPEQMRKSYRLLNSYYKQLKGMSLEDILSEGFKFKLPYFHEDKLVGDEIVNKIGLTESKRPEHIKQDLDHIYEGARFLLNRMYHHLGRD